MERRPGTLGQAHPGKCPGTPEQEQAHPGKRPGTLLQGHSGRPASGTTAGMRVGGCLGACQEARDEQQRHRPISASCRSTDCWPWASRCCCCANYCCCCRSADSCCSSWRREDLADWLMLLEQEHEVLKKRYWQWAQLGQRQLLWQPGPKQMSRAWWPSRSLRVADRCRPPQRSRMGFAT
jgi:hypothetical protein